MHSEEEDTERSDLDEESEGAQNRLDYKQKTQDGSESRYQSDRQDYREAMGREPRGKQQRKRPPV